MNRDWLGRTAPTNTKHLEAYPFASSVDTDVRIEKNIPRPKASKYNQKATPRCVGYSTSKVVNWFNKMSYNADWLYAECKKIDGFSGDGTNANAACQVLKLKGHQQTIAGINVPGGPKRKHGIASYRWATSVDQIRAVFAGPRPQPVLLGIDWYEAWFGPQSHTDGSHWLQPINRAGAVAGGHEIGIWACSDERQAFGLSNTWGDAWPELVWAPYAIVEQLLAGSGDACVLTDLATR